MNRSPEIIDTDASPQWSNHGAVVVLSAGHWGWFSIACGTLFLTMTISGLYAAIEHTIPDTAWIPQFLKERPFFIGFFLMYVPFATVKACQAALIQHEALHGAGGTSATSTTVRCCAHRLMWPLRTKPYDPPFGVTLLLRWPAKH